MNTLHDLFHFMHNPRPRRLSGVDIISAAVVLSLALAYAYAVILAIYYP